MIFKIFKHTSIQTYLFKFLFPIFIAALFGGISTAYILHEYAAHDLTMELFGLFILLILLLVAFSASYLSKSIGKEMTNTALKKEYVLNKSNQKYQAIFEQAAVGVARVNLDGSWLEVNQKLCDIVGYSKEELLTKTFQDITHPDDLEIDLEYLNQLLNGKIKTYSMNKRYFKKNANEVWVNLTVSLVSDKNNNPKYFVSIIEDITDKKLLDMVLQNNEKRLLHLLDSLSVGVIIHNKDSSIEQSNTKASELFRLEKSKLKGLKNKDSYWRFFDEYENVLSVEQYPVSIMLRNKQNISNMIIGISFENKNDITWVLVNGIVVLDDDNEIIELITNFIDITELKNKDEMLISQSRFAAMGEMISMIAHQWRQPITVISMFANHILMDVELEQLDDTKALKYAHSINEHTQHLSNTINDFRDFFRPDKLSSSINMSNILQKTMSIVSDSLKNNKIELSSSIKSNLEVQGFPRELIQVLVNIINNAKDALIISKQENPFISIKIFEEDKYLVIEVCDNANGIQKNDLPKIFNPYFSTKNEKNGTGLGLYMSKMIVEKHHKGLLDVRTANTGSCFSVKLLK